jgi:hypothetical protein
MTYVHENEALSSFFDAGPLIYGRGGFIDFRESTMSFLNHQISRDQIAIVARERKIMFLSAD